MKNKNHIFHALYIRNNIAHDHDFLVQLCKMMISSGVFVFFFNFDFSSCWGGKMAKNSPT